MLIAIKRVISNENLYLIMADHEIWKTVSKFTRIYLENVGSTFLFIYSLLALFAVNI